MKRILTRISILLVGLYLPFAANAYICTNQLINPTTDVNWNNAFPFSIGPVEYPGTGNYPSPAIMKMNAFCLVGCSTTPPVIGVGVTMWAPEFLAEIQATPGCSPTLGGAMLPNQFGMESQAHTDQAGRQKTESRKMNAHWFKYPLFAAMSIFTTISCANISNVVAAGDFTELDNPFWQDSKWAGILNPDSFLFANQIALAACLPDVVVSTFSNPLDILVWCVGAQGPLFPITGEATNAASGQSIASGNMLVLAKFMHGLTRQFRLMLQIGPPYHCAVPKLTPYLFRSQYRIDPAKPLHTNQAVRFGKIDTFWAQYPPLNPARDYSSTFFIWQALQCCVPVAP